MNIIVKPYGNDLCYCRPDTTWERENRDFYSPECVNAIFWTPVVFARVSKAGKCIGSKFVERYYDEVGCGMLMYCHANPQVTSIDSRFRFAQTPPIQGWENADSDHQAAPADKKDFGSISACVDHTSILPMPLHNPAVLENDGNGYRVEVGSKTVPGTTNCHHIILKEAKNLLEKAICDASELISLRTGDFVAVELEAMKELASRENGDVDVKGIFCENEIFDFKVIF